MDLNPESITLEWSDFDLDNDADYEWAVENVKGFQAEIDWWIKWVLKGENSNKIV